MRTSPFEQIQQTKYYLQKYDAKADTGHYIQPYECLSSEIDTICVV